MILKKKQFLNILQDCIINAYFNENLIIMSKAELGFFRQLHQNQNGLVLVKEFSAITIFL